MINYDVPVIKKLHPTWQYKGILLDTQVAAGTLWPAEHLTPRYLKMSMAGKFPSKLVKSPHSLEAWGHVLGVHKGEYTQWCKDNGISDPWAAWRPEMQEYCEGDTDTTKALVRAIQGGGLTREPIETEHELAAYLFQQQQNGVPFDLEGAQRLTAHLAGRLENLGQQLRDVFVGFVKDKGEHTPLVGNKTRGIVKGCKYSKIEIVEFSPTSRDHIAYVLQKRYGWKPDRYTEGGKPEVDEKALKGMKFPEAPLLIEYLTIDKRLGLVANGKQAWINHAVLNPETGCYHIHHRVKQNTPITHRCSHASPNLGQVPKVGKPFGEESRALFYAPPGWVMIGADMSSLELRCLAHYMARYDDGEYGKAVVEGKNEDGTDVHSVNMRALAEFLSQDKKGRDDAKTFIYAYLYGAGDEKLGSIVAPAASSAKKRSIGKGLRAAFEKNVPALKYLVAAVKRSSKAGYLITLDGRKVYVRHDHAALNTLLQTAGAIICKRWVVESSRRLTSEFGPQGWSGQWAACLFVHDEMEHIVRPQNVERHSQILIESAQYMTQHFNFRVPLTGEAKVGQTWKSVH